MTDLDQRIISTLREHAEGHVDIGQLTSGAVTRGRVRRTRRRAAVGGTALGVAAVLGLGVAGGGGLPVEVPWTGAKPATRAATPAAAPGVPGALTRPDLVGKDPDLLHFGVDPVRARYLSWRSAAGLESAELDLGGSAPVSFYLARSAAVAEGVHLEGDRLIPQPADIPYDGQLDRLSTSGAVPIWVLRWQPVPGLFARLRTEAPTDAALRVAKIALRLDVAHQCSAPVRLTTLPAGAWKAGCEVNVANLPATLDVSLIVNARGDRSMEVRLQYARSIAGERREPNATAAGRPTYRYAQGGMMELLGIPKAHLTAGWGWPNKGFTGEDAATVLGGVQVAEHLDRPATW
ncbi:hypothetical protein NIE79_004169 [Micromonospora sp. NIE79]|uniref:Transcriptional initiation protein Tat n=1 Tax=Micromonospora trifolii TaxID=2911208 RepID=A0ABS9MW28_9ACTN|nr:hypothetical protein [Micromonospora trifolii]MCG5441907.1 hypothetical protein [Micromonospora trifolii]